MMDIHRANLNRYVLEDCIIIITYQVGLIDRVVTVLGQQKALELLYATENIEANGGLMICNGTRRRTPGGVYLHLLRSNTQISSDDIDNIFAPERAEAREIVKKRKRSELEKKAVRTIRRLEETILGERPTSSDSSSSDDEMEDGRHFGAKRTKSESAMTDGDCVNIALSRDRKRVVERTSDLEEGEIDD